MADLSVVSSNNNEQSCNFTFHYHHESSSSEKLDTISWRCSTSSMSLFDSMDSADEQKPESTKATSKAALPAVKVIKNTSKPKNFIKLNQKAVSRYIDVRNLSGVREPNTTASSSLPKNFIPHLQSISKCGARKFPQATACSFNNNFNSNVVKTDYIRLPWPGERSKHQTEYYFKGEVDRLERIRDDLTRRNEYLNREIKREIRSLSLSQAGRMLANERERNKSFYQRQAEARKQDKAAKLRVEIAERSEAHANTMYKSLMTQRNESEQERKKLQAHHEREETERKRLQDEEKTLENTYNNRCRELKDCINILESQVNENIQKENDITEIEAKLASVAEKFGTSSAKLSSMNQQTREVKVKIESSKSTLESIDREIKVLTVEQEKIVRVLKAVKTESDRLTEEVIVSRAKLDRARKKYLELEEKKMHRKEISIQTLGIMSVVQDVAWIRIAEESTIYSPFVDGGSSNTNRTSGEWKTPVVEIFDVSSSLDDKVYDKMPMCSNLGNRTRVYLSNSNVSMDRVGRTEGK